MIRWITRAEATRVARGIRRSIVEEHPARAFSEQVSLFADDGADVTKTDGGAQ